MVDTITTSSDGFVKSKELYLGKYEVKEITAPDGMVVSGEKMCIRDSRQIMYLES